MSSSLSLTRSLYRSGQRVGKTNCFSTKAQTNGEILKQSLSQAKAAGDNKISPKTHSWVSDEEFAIYIKSLAVKKGWTSKDKEEAVASFSSGMKSSESSRKIIHDYIESMSVGKKNVESAKVDEWKNAEATKVGHAANSTKVGDETTNIESSTQSANSSTQTTNSSTQSANSSTQSSTKSLETPSTSSVPLISKNKQSLFFNLLLTKMETGPMSGHHQLGTKGLDIVKSTLDWEQYNKLNLILCKIQKDDIQRELILLLADMIGCTKEKITKAMTTGCVNDIQNEIHKEITLMIDSAVLFGESGLYPGEIFDFISQNILLLTSPRHMALYLQETGRHGLRCKHFVDRVIQQATLMSPRMDLESLMRGCQGLVRFTRDWQMFFHTSRDRIMRELTSQQHQLQKFQLGKGSKPSFVFDTKELLTMLKICREFKGVGPYMKLQADVCEILGRKLREEASCREVVKGETGNEIDAQTSKSSGTTAILEKQTVQSVISDKPSFSPTGTHGLNPTPTPMKATQIDGQGKNLGPNELFRDYTFPLSLAIFSLYDISWDRRLPQRELKKYVQIVVERLEKEFTGLEGKSVDGDTFDESTNKIFFTSTTQFPPEIQRLNVVELTRGFESIVSWNCQTPKLLHHLGMFFADRISEIRYSPNVGLWHSITQSFANAGYYPDPWMSVLTPLLRDKYMLDRLSFFQHNSMSLSLGKLRFNDADSWEALAGIMLPNLDLCREPEHISPILWSFVMVDHVKRERMDYLKQNTNNEVDCHVISNNNSGNTNVIGGTTSLDGDLYHPWQYTGSLSGDTSDTSVVRYRNSAKMFSMLWEILFRNILKYNADTNSSPNSMSTTNFNPLRNQTVSQALVSLTWSFAYGEFHKQDTKRFACLMDMLVLVMERKGMLNDGSANNVATPSKIQPRIIPGKSPNTTTPPRTRKAFDPYGELPPSDSSSGNGPDGSRSAGDVNFKSLNNTCHASTLDPRTGLDKIAQICHLVVKEAPEVFDHLSAGNKEKLLGYLEKTKIISSLEETSLNEINSKRDILSAHSQHSFSSETEETPSLSTLSHLKTEILNHLKTIVKANTILSSPEEIKQAIPSCVSQPDIVYLSSYSLSDSESNASNLNAVFLMPYSLRTNSVLEKRRKMRMMRQEAIQHTTDLTSNEQKKELYFLNGQQQYSVRILQSYGYNVKVVYEEEWKEQGDFSHRL